MSDFHPSLKEWFGVKNKCDHILGPDEYIDMLCRALTLLDKYSPHHDLDKDIYEWWNNHKVRNKKDEK